MEGDPGRRTVAVLVFEGVAWIRKAAAEAEIVLSVCMGAFLLAEAGLLEVAEATTHRWGLKGLKKAAPGCRVVAGPRFVESGKIVTTAGVSAGLDGALRVVERLAGTEAARWTAEDWMEYAPRTPCGGEAGAGPYGPGSEPAA